MNDKKPFADFTTAALWVLIINVLAVAVTSVSQLVLKNPWPQLLFLSVFQPQDRAFFTALLAAMPLFSPLVVVLVASLMPLLIHLLAMMMLIGCMRAWNWKARLVYFCMALVPVFGPVAAQTIMKSMGEIEE